jgi:hypothetical protein
VLQRAFTKACLAERAWRLTHAEEPVVARPRRRSSVGERPAMGVVIEMPRVWRQRCAGGSRRDE